jgi:hypothetical protein
MIPIVCPAPLCSKVAENTGFSMGYAALGRTEMYSGMEAAFFGNEKPLATLLFDISEH